jgi:hypothetical protein
VKILAAVPEVTSSPPGPFSVWWTKGTEVRHSPSAIYARTSVMRGEQGYVVK